MAKKGDLMLKQMALSWLGLQREPFQSVKDCRQAVTMLLKGLGKDQDVI